MRRQDLVQSKQNKAVKGVIIRTEYENSDSEGDDDEQWRDVASNGHTSDSDQDDRSDFVCPGLVRVKWQNIEQIKMVEFKAVTEHSCKNSIDIRECPVDDLELVDRTFLTGDAVIQQPSGRRGLVSKVQKKLSVTPLISQQSNTRTIFAMDEVSCDEVKPFFPVSKNDLVLFKNQVATVCDICYCYTLKVASDQTSGGRSTRGGNKNRGTKSRGVGLFKLELWDRSSRGAGGLMNMMPMDNMDLMNYQPRLVNGLGLCPEPEDDYEDWDMADIGYRLYPSMLVSILVNNKRVTATVLNANMVKVKLSVIACLPYKSVDDTRRKLDGENSIKMVTDLSKVQRLKYNIHEEYERGDVVLFKYPHVEQEVASVITRTRTIVDVKFRDGSMGSALPATSLIPMSKMDDDDNLWIGDLVLCHGIVTKLVSIDESTSSVTVKAGDGTIISCPYDKVARIQLTDDLIGTLVVNRDPEENIKRQIGFVLDRNVNGDLLVHWISSSSADRLEQTESWCDSYELKYILNMVEGQVNMWTQLLVTPIMASRPFILNGVPSLHALVQCAPPSYVLEALCVKYVAEIKSAERVVHGPKDHFLLLDAPLPDNHLCLAEPIATSKSSFLKRLSEEYYLMKMDGGLFDNVYVQIYECRGELFRALFLMDSEECSIFFGLCLLVDGYVPEYYPEAYVIMKYHQWFTNLLLIQDKFGMHPCLSPDGMVDCFKLDDALSENGSYALNLDVVNIAKLLNSLSAQLDATEDNLNTVSQLQISGKTSILGRRKEPIKVDQMKDRLMCVKFHHIRYLLFGYTDLEFKQTKEFESVVGRAWISSLVGSSMVDLVVEFYIKHKEALVAQIKDWLSTTTLDKDFKTEPKQLLQDFETYKLQ
ncbi:hypothetical protein MP228_011516 [Amoeboaphelidium protococcarum]|nr:hypothetical protein MP228_011516 [Amoeboaphelidium protococcarum]